MKKLLKPGEVLPKKTEQESNIVLEDQPRICPIVLDLLNKQIKNELFSSQIYASMASWLDDKRWSNGSKLFLKYSKEEQVHMYKIYEFLFLKNCKAITSEIPEPPKDFSDIRDILTKSLEHEIEVTKNWFDISITARDNNCIDVFYFAEWFVAEQCEEEEKFRDLLFLLDKNIPDWKLEEIFGEKI